MTEHEDLIAEARDLAEMSRETRHGVPSHCDMMDRLADALEKVTAERDALKVDLETKSIIHECCEKAQERNELAARLDKVFNLSKRAGTFGADEFGLFKSELRTILNAATSAALDRVRAEALREAADGFRLYGDNDYSAVTVIVVENYLKDRADRIEKGESNDQ